MINITIETVSERAGVSKATVSRYLNEKYEHMSEKTRLRIKNVIEELNYRPNLIARNLKTKKTGLIGLIVSDVTNPVTSHLIKGVTDFAGEMGYQVIIASSEECVHKEREYILSMVDRQIDGFIIAVAEFSEYSLLKSLASDGVHFVLADRTIDNNIFDTVTTNNYDMTKKTIDTLYKIGYERVALFSSELLKSRVRLLRYNAFLEASKKYISSPKEIAYIADTEEEYIKCLVDFMKLGGKKAVFASTPMALLNLYNAAHELKLEIPLDLGACGYDNISWTKLIGGGVTIVDQPIYEVGAEAAKLLIARIKDESVELEPKYIELSSKLILRNSTVI